jgi:hypothetical protein
MRVGRGAASGVSGQWFHVAMSLLIVAVVVYGFSRTVGDAMFHPVVARPTILFVHATIFSLWLVFFTFQVVLVRTRNVRWHRRAGLFGVALGAVVSAVGIATAVVMARFNIAALGVPAADAEGFLVIPFTDMLCFTTTFALAIRWRKQADRHRRLILIATCTLTAAAFGRFPTSILPPYLFYAGVDALILLGVLRDLIVDRRIHLVYLWVLPFLIVVQTLATYTAFHTSGPWMPLAHAIIG